MPTLAVNSIGPQKSATDKGQDDLYHMLRMWNTVNRALFRTHGEEVWKATNVEITSSGSDTFIARVSKKGKRLTPSRLSRFNHRIFSNQEFIDNFKDVGEEAGLDMRHL